ncbi:unnamed protein product [Prunus brigantina]
MEHGSLTDPSQSTFSLVDEDHTFANAARFHFESGVSAFYLFYNVLLWSSNLRASPGCDAAKDVFNDSCQDLMVICQHVRSTFDKAVVDFRMSKSVNGMDIDSNN